MLTCASEEQLADFVLGACDPDESRDIALHLERCGACRDWVREASSDGALFDNVRRVLSDDVRRVAVAGEPTRSSAAADWSAAVRPPIGDPQIEGYQVLRELGRGGMGVVYLALQASTKRKVALKVLLEGPFASPAAKRRFEREVELAALLEHPNVVNILESGIASGRYYFAMRYVEGRRLDEAISDVGFRISDAALRRGGASEIRNPKSEMGARLDLFRRVCDAVAYAHQRGVIHRDLKPSNVIVDDAGNPYVLDFGLAKPVEEAPITEEAATKLSITGHVMGTLAYMAPEQAAGAHRDVDVRSDVYSLGVMLYQMLTAQFPYPVTGRVTEILKHIAETEPRRPSTLSRQVNNELETILLKSLAKEPGRRYQSADALAGDLRRYLTGQPIEAKRDSGWYVARKLASRNRVPIAVALAFLVLVGVGGYITLSRQARVDRALVAGVLAAFVDDPPAAMRRSAELKPGVRAMLAQAAAEKAASAAYTERIAAARCGPWVNPDAFWKSVDGGPLWLNGEWLEVVEVASLDPPALTAQLVEKATHGSEIQKYVAFCLLGQMANGQPTPEVAALCERAVKTEAHPGVAAAAGWASEHWGREIAPASQVGRFVDALSGLVYSRVPATDSFRRGSSPDDPDRYPDEDVRGEAVSIAAFTLATTEVSYAAFAPFLSEPGVRESLPEDAARWFAAVEALAAEERAGVAVGHVSLNLARRYCEWLNRRAQAQNLPNRYRLPTEEEWEYACSGGNSGRFCYGDDPKYARYFAQCDGRPTRFHRVGRLMPNAFGLHDMHGGLWERTETRYPPELVTEPELAGQELWVQKGGATYSPAVRCRRAQRNYAAANAANDYNGFRIVMESARP